MQLVFTRSPPLVYTLAMLRIAFFLWFTFTSLLGPGFCCCSIRNYAATGKTKTKTPWRVSLFPGCKFCDRIQKGASDPTPARQDESPTPSCPCKQHAKQKAISLPSPEIETVSWVRSLDVFSADSLLDGLMRLHHLAAGFDGSVSDFVFPPPSSLLCRCHILRC